MQAAQANVDMLAWTFAATACVLLTPEQPFTIILQGLHCFNAEAVAFISCNPVKLLCSGLAGFDSDDFNVIMFARICVLIHQCFWLGLVCHVDHMAQASYSLCIHLHRHIQFAKTTKMLHLHVMRWRCSHVMQVNRPSVALRSWDMPCILVDPFHAV